MKYIILLAFPLLVMLLADCKTHRKIVYNIPADYTKEQREAFMARMNKGAELYKQYCGDCHGIFNDGKDGIPDFTNIQIDNYSARFLAGDKQNHAVAMDMSHDQFFAVMNFLKSRKVDSVSTQSNTPLAPIRGRH